MSRTKKVFFRGKNNKPNPYGLCMCVECKRGRIRTRHGIVDKIKHRQRTGWKTGKKDEKGAYTD